MIRRLAACLLALGVAACAQEPAPDKLEGNGVVLRNLAETDVSAPARDQYALQGRLIPTPSDTASRYFLLRERREISGNIVAIIRQEHAGRIAYARTEVDCARRLFHVLGVGASRADAEVATTYDGPLRSIARLPLREELARFVCQQSGTPLAAAPSAAAG